MFDNCENIRLQIVVDRVQGVQRAFNLYWIEKYSSQLRQNAGPGARNSLREFSLFPETALKQFHNSGFPAYEVGIPSCIRYLLLSLVSHSEWNYEMKTRFAESQAQLALNGGRSCLIVQLLIDKERAADVFIQTTSSKQKKGCHTSPGHLYIIKFSP